MVALLFFPIHIRSFCVITFFDLPTYLRVFFLPFFFFFLCSECISQRQAVEATLILSPMVVDASNEYLTVPIGSPFAAEGNGYATFLFSVFRAGAAQFEGEVIAPDGGSDSFLVSIDGGARVLWLVFSPVPDVHLDKLALDCTSQLRHPLDGQPHSHNNREGAFLQKAACSAAFVRLSSTRRSGSQPLTFF